MAEKDWAAILKDEDRIIANSDRRLYERGTYIPGAVYLYPG